MKKLISTILAIMMLTSVFAGISVSAEVITSPAVHMQEKVVYHETFEDFETNPNPDFEINSRWFEYTYKERNDGNGKALVCSTKSAKAETVNSWVRFLHEAAGDRKLKLYEYMDDSDITEISIDVFLPEPRDFSINMATTGWGWQHSMNVSANGYVYYIDREIADNKRAEAWGGSDTAIDTQKVSKEWFESQGWSQDYIADVEFGKWHTFKYVYDSKANVMTTYIDNTIIGRRVNLASWPKMGLITFEDQTALDAGVESFRLDNFKITQKNYAPIVNQTYLEDYDTTGTTSFDTSKHWKANVAPTVVATEDSEHGNALSINVGTELKNATTASDDVTIRYFVSGDKISEKKYMDADISVIEADFMVPAKRRMSVELITTGWHHHAVITSLNDWVCFVGNQGRPAQGGTNANNWQTKTKKQMLTSNADAATGHIAGFPLFYGGSLNETWHHIRFVRDKENKTLTAYLDDVCLGTRTYDAEPLGLAFSSQTPGLVTGDLVMTIDNIRIGSIADSTAPSLSITDTEGKAVSSVTAGNTYFAKMDGIKNNTNADKKMQLFVAAYDENNCFLGLDSYAYTVPANTSLASEGEALGVVQLTAPEGAKKMKVFAWSDFETNIPICATAEVK